MNLAPRDQLLNALSRVLPEKAGIAVIHSSLPALGPPQGFSPWDALYSLGTLACRGWTVALPAFTFSFCSGGFFSVKKSPSESGMLADALLQYFPEALRTPHPIYSFGVLGPRAVEIADCRSSTTFGDDSPFALFEREHATIVMMGCSWAYNTQFHRYEEIAAVPYRYKKIFSGTADFGNGPHEVHAAMWVRDLAANPINNFDPAICRLRTAGSIISAPLWRGQIEAAAAEDIARVCRADLAADPYAYVANVRQVSSVLARRAEAEAQPILRIAVLGSFNLHILEQAWRTQLDEMLPARRIEHTLVPFGYLHPSILESSSELYRQAPSIRVFCDRLEDVATDSSMNLEQLAGAVRQYAELIATLHRNIAGWTIVHRFAVIGVAADSGVLRANAVRVEKMNAILDQVLSSLPQIVWVDLAAEAAAYDGPAVDARLWYVGRFAFANGFSHHLARRWSSLTLAMLGKTARVVVVDLDNTLWGGVLGEEGLSGIKIGGDYPGNAFAAFQRALKGLRERGIVLAISSKNDEDLALRAIDELPSMQLRSVHFSARRINWRAKWENILDIAAELNLGLESVLFVDDNPLEREAVRRNLPEVNVMDLPSDPALYADALLASPYLSTVTITNEDVRRADEFLARKKRETQHTQAASLEDYYMSLGMVLHLSSLDEGNTQRAAQLCQKTNQFNTTTRRYDLRALAKLADGGADVIVIGLSDRYSPLENIGLIILQPEHEATGRVDLYLLSCRVLGRGIETAILEWAIGRAAQRGWRKLRGEIIETERNTPVRKVFADTGFEADGPGFWSIDTGVEPTLPRWLTIVVQVNQ